MDEFQYKMIEAIAKGLSDSAIDKATDLTKQAAIAAWGKLKSVLGWKTDPTPEEVRALVTKALAEQPQLAPQVANILNDYSKQATIATGGTAGRDYFDFRDAKINTNGGAKFGGG